MNQKGFIPLLIIIIASIILASAGTGVVLHGQGKLTPFIANIAEVLKGTEEITKQKKFENSEKIDEDFEIEKLKKEIESLKKTTEAKTQTLQKTEISTIPQNNGDKVLKNAEIIKKVKPVVVFIEVKNGSGSGIIIDKNGFILTNAHVVVGVSSAQIKLSNNKSFTASIVGRDENIDLAVLKIDVDGLEIVDFGDSDQVEQGDEVFTLGYPFGLEGDVSFKEGTISRRLVEEGKTYLETSAEIHPGNSGGPLVDNQGNIIGINTAVIGKSFQGISLGETIKLAIPINIAKDFIPLLKTGRVVVLPKEAENQETTLSDCQKVKDDFSNLKKQYDALWTLRSDIIDSIFAGNTDISYEYRRLLSIKESIYYKISQFQTRVEELKLSYFGSNELADLKLNLIRGGNKYMDLFNFKLLALSLGGDYGDAYSNAKTANQDAANFYKAASENFIKIIKLYSQLLSDKKCQ